jgi:16S rRNA A1518/A1519 N6-dimethyltransferase RsmA/KsgA/DIM1 with predicted DNA glycosylase/AP lyase activity
MPDSCAFAKLADQSLGQFFLTSSDKLALLVKAAGFQPGDRVVEVGAGAGTVARMVPANASLTAIELDDRLLPTLRKNVPEARVIQGDALRILPETPCDVLLGNLPNAVTERLLDLLPNLSFRTAVLAIAGDTVLKRISRQFTIEEITTLEGDDFEPPQASRSRLVKITPSQVTPVRPDPRDDRR